jgi:hypothetical protein
MFSVFLNSIMSNKQLIVNNTLYSSNVKKLVMLNYI